LGLFIGINLTPCIPLSTLGEGEEKLDERGFAPLGLPN